MIDKKIVGRRWQDIEAGSSLPAISLGITYEKVAGHIYGTRDWFPGHHNPDYAKAQGRENIFVNTMFFQSFLDRLAIEWAGSGWFVHKRSLQMHASVYPGDTLVGKGYVVDKSTLDDGSALVALDLWGSTERQESPVITSRTTLMLPKRSQELLS